MGAAGGVLTHVPKRVSGTGPAVESGPSGRKEEQPMAEAYCVKCKTKREVQNPQQITMKNGKPALKGTCPVCGTSLFKIGG